MAFHSRKKLLTLHQEFLTALTNPVDPLFKAGEVRAITYRDVSDAANEVSSALTVLKEKTDPELVLLLDGHGNEDQTTCIYNSAVSNATIFRALIEPALAYVREGRHLKVSLLINTCYSGMYLEVGKAFAKSAEMDTRLEINIMTSSPADAKAIGNNVIYQVEAAHTILKALGNYASEICPKCTEFQRLTLVAHRVGWGLSQHVEDKYKRNPQVWFSREYPNFSFRELQLLEEGAYLTLRGLAESHPDSSQLGKWLNIYYLLIHLTAEKAHDADSNPSSRSALKTLFESQLGELRSIEQIYSGPRKTVWRRWSEFLQAQIENH